MLFYGKDPHRLNDTYVGASMRPHISVAAIANRFYIKFHSYCPPLFHQHLPLHTN